MMDSEKMLNARNFILDNVDRYPRSVVRETANSLLISISSVNKVINNLVIEGKLFRRGRTKGIYYRLPNSKRKRLSIVKIELSILGSDSYILRSEAEQFFLDLEIFDLVILDFMNVRMVSRDFADEVFRVYQNQFWDKEIKYINANPEIEFMIHNIIHSHY